MPFARPLTAFALSFVVTVPALASAAGEAPAAEARVEIKLSDAEGHTVELVGQHLAWNQTHRLAEKVDDHEYGVAIAVKKGDADKLTVALTYERDGATVVERHDLRAKLAQPVKIESDAGDVVFVVSVEPPREKLEVGDSDDPLGGI